MVSFPHLKAPLLLSPSTASAGLDLIVSKLFYSSWSLTVWVAPNTFYEQTAPSLQCCQVNPSTGRPNTRSSPLPSSTAGNSQQRRGIHCGKNPGQQSYQPETVLSSQVGRVQNQTQLLGISGWCSCPRVHSGFSLETSQSPLTHPIHRLWHHSFLNAITRSTGTLLPWRGGRHLFRPPSLMEYLRATTLETFHSHDPLYIPPHCH